MISEAGLLLAVLLSALLSAQTPVPRNQREFSSGYAGTLPTDARDLAGTYFKQAAVQQLLISMEREPIPTDRARQALKGTPATVEDLLRLGLVSEREGRLFIAFNYFNEADVRAVAQVGARYVPLLVHAYLNRRKDFDRIFSSYSVRTVPREEIAFVLIAGFSLNWDGLRTTRELGYRKPILVRGPTWHYSFWASEDVPDHSHKEFYWGSSTFPAGQYNFADRPADYTFSSFGDPFSDPRMNFPDLLYTPGAVMVPAVREAAQAVGLMHETAFGTDLADVLGFERARDVAAILFALRTGQRTEAELAERINRPDTIGAYLLLLERIQYVEKGENGRYCLLVPVFDQSDKALVDRSLELSRQVISDWLKANFRSMRGDLGPLTATRHGVPFESLFTQIWHEWFGLATRELVHAGFIFDPYGGDRRYKGSVPVLWRSSLFDLGRLD